MDPLDELREALPTLAQLPHEITSPPTTRYNCVAWAAGDETTWWWPDAQRFYYWPIRQRSVSLESFRAAFATLGYAPAASTAQEAGIEKVAIYARGECPTHVARQLPDGQWTSKCGRLHDLTHTLEALEGTEYGSVRLVLMRPRTP